MCKSAKVNISMLEYWGVVAWVLLEFSKVFFSGI